MGGAADDVDIELGKIGKRLFIECGVARTNVLQVRKPGFPENG
jgi:hypothetical protein